MKALPLMPTIETTLEKRSMRIAGIRTSVALEIEFWNEAVRIAKVRGQSLPVLFAAIDERRARETPGASLASAIRVFILQNKIQGGRCG